MATLTGHRAALRTLAFSPDGRLLATGGLDREIILWDVTTLHPWATLTGHTDLILGLAFSPAGGTLASSAGDHTVIIWPIDPQRARTHIETALSS
jgi:WD40 repeat protein